MSAGEELGTRELVADAVLVDDKERSARFEELLRRIMAGLMAKQVILAIVLLGACAKVDGAFFTWRTVLQDNCFPGEENTITVVLQSDTTLDRDTAISIRGLRKAIVENHDAVELSGDNHDLFSNGGCGTGTASRAIWVEKESVEQGGQAVEEDVWALVVWPRDPLANGTRFSFSFKVTNPEEEQMPDVTVKATGGVGIAEVPVWTKTQLTSNSLVVVDSDRCMPTSATDPTAHIDGSKHRDRHGNLYTDRAVTLDLKYRLPSALTFNVEDCRGDAGELYADGVQSVAVTGGCGCTASSGRIVANGGDGKFSATFNIKYACVESVNGNPTTVAEDDMESCRKACQAHSIATIGAEDGDFVCISQLDSTNIEIEQPGWGYSSPPALTVVGDPGCDLEFTATISTGSGFAASYNISRYNCGGCYVLPDECTSTGCQNCVGEAVAVVTNRGKDFDGTAVTLSRKGGCRVQGGLQSDANVARDRHLFSGSVNDDTMCSEVSPSACYHTVPEVVVEEWDGCEGAFEVVTETPKINFCDSEYGDAYPMKIRGYNFVQKRIRQETTGPGAQNTLTVSLVTAFRLVQGAVVHIEGMDNAGLDNGAVKLTFVSVDGNPGNPGYKDEAMWICPSTLAITVQSEVAPGACAVFTFLATNNRPRQEQPAKQVRIMVDRNGPRNTTWQDMEMGDDGTTGTDLAHSQPFHVLPAQFTTCRTYQLFSYPREPSAEYKTSDGTVRIGGISIADPRLNMIYFNFATNFDIEVTTFIEISGLDGIRMESSIRDFENFDDHDDFSSLFCSKRGPAAAALLCPIPSSVGKFKWDDEKKTMTFYPVAKITAGRQIKLRAQVAMTQSGNPDIYIRTVQHRTSFESDTMIFAGFEVDKKKMELGLDGDSNCPHSMWNQKREETIPFSSRSPEFYVRTMHQHNPYLEESNTITVTLALNVPLFPDSTITLRADHSKWVDTGFTVIEGDNHDDEFKLTIEPGAEKELKAQVTEVAEVMVPGWCYTLEVKSITNPTFAEFESAMESRVASDVMLTLDVPALGPLQMMKSDSGLATGCLVEDDFHPFRHRDPTTFCSTYIQQTSSTPGETNTVKLTVASYYRYTRAFLRLTRWPISLAFTDIVAQNTSNHAMSPERVSTMGPFVMTPGSEYSYTFTVSNWEYDEQYTVLNTNIYALPKDGEHYLNRDPETFNVALLDGGSLLSPGDVKIPDTPLDADDMPTESVCPQDMRPLRILAPGVCSCTISSSSVVLPNQNNQLTISFRTTVDVPSARGVSRNTQFTLTQTTGSAWTPIAGSPIPENAIVDFLNYDSDLNQLQIWNVTANALSSNSFSYTVKIPVIPLSEGNQQPVFQLAIPELNPSQVVTCESELQVLRPTFTLAKVGQVNPYPLADNNIVVTIRANYKPDAGDWFIHLELTNIDNPNDIILDVDGNENTRGIVNIAEPVGACNGLDNACTVTSGNISVFVDPEAEDGVTIARRGRFVPDTANRRASIWFKVTSMFEVEAQYVFFFVLQNPPKARDSMGVSVTAEREYLTAYVEDPHIPRTGLLEGSGVFAGCNIFSPMSRDSHPLFVRQPEVVSSTICQSSMFPSTENTISVSVVLNTAIPSGTTLTISGLSGLFVSQEDGLDQIRDITGSIDPASVGRVDQPDGLQLLFRVKNDPRPDDDTARGIQFTFKTDNPPDAQSAATPTVKMDGLTQISLISTALGACQRPENQVLFIVQPEFTRRVINQKIPYPGAINTLFLTIESNVPLVDNTQFLITGLTAESAPGLDFAELEGDSLSATLVQALCVKEELVTDTDVFVKGVNEQTNDEQVGSVTGIRRKCAADSTSICELQMRFGITRENPAFNPIRFGIRVVNPTLIQDAPDIFLETTEGTKISRILMEPDRTTCDDCTLADNAAALKIVDADFRSATIEQTNPWPLGENNIIITFDSRVALEPGTIVTVRGFPKVGIEKLASDGLADYTSNSVAALRIDETQVDTQGEGCFDGDVRDSNGRAFDAKFPAACGKVEDDIIITEPGDAFDLDTQLAPDFVGCRVQPVDIEGGITYTRDVFIVTRHEDEGELRFTVKDDTRTTRCSKLRIKIPVNNPHNTGNADVDGGWELDLTTNMVIEATAGAAGRGVKVLPRTVDVDPNSRSVENSAGHFTICGRDVSCPSNRSLDVQLGDAVPFKLYPPEFVYWRMSQSMPYPDACNVISVTFKSNLDIPVGTNVNMTFFMSDQSTNTHPIAPSPGGYAEDVDTTTAPKLQGEQCTVLVANSLYQCTLEQVMPGLVVGDYIRSYSGLERETEFVPISSIFRVTAIDGNTLWLVPDDTGGVREPEANNYFAKVVYIKPIPGEQGDEVFERGAYLKAGTAGWHQAVLVLDVTRPVLAGREYAFQFAVRNAIPPSDTAGASRIVVASSVAGTGIVWTSKEATLDTTSVIIQTESDTKNNLTAHVNIAQMDEDTEIHVSGDMPLHYFGPGIHLQIDDEIMMLVHHGNNSLMVRRGQIGTMPTQHVMGSSVRPILPGSMPGDRVPFAVHQQRLELHFGRQTNPLPGKFNRHQYTFAANFPLNKFHLLSVDPLLGAKPAFGVIEPPCLRSNQLDRRCSALEPERSDFFPDVMMPVYDTALDSFNKMAMMLKLSALSDRLEIVTTLPNVTNMTNHTAAALNMTKFFLLRETYDPDWMGFESTFPRFVDNVSHCGVDAMAEQVFQAGDYLRINDEVLYVISDCTLLRAQLGTTLANHSHRSVLYSIKEEGVSNFFGECRSQLPARNVVPPGHLYQFTYAVLNPASPERDRQNAVATKANLTFAPDSYEFVSSISYDNKSLPLGEFDEFGMTGDLHLMEVYGKTFINAQVGQNSPNPGHLENTICVTMRPSFTVPKHSTTTTKFTLTGFTNGIHEEADIDIQTVMGPAGTFSSPGKWNADDFTIEFELNEGLQAGREYQMCFDLKNPPDQQAEQTISLSSTGQVESVSIKAKNFTDCGCVEGWYKLGGVAGTGGSGQGFSAYVYVDENTGEPFISFVDQVELPPPNGRVAPTRGDGYTMAPEVEFTACSAIGTDRGATPGNDCQCTCTAEDMFAVNVDGISAVRDVTVRCSEHVEWDDTNKMIIAEDGMGDGLFEAKFEATNSTNRRTNRIVIQHHGNHYLYTPYSENVSDIDCMCDADGQPEPGSGESCRCNGPKLKLADQYAAICNISVTTTVVRGSMIISEHILTNALGDHAPLLIHEPAWRTTVIAQGSPWPGAYNEMTITLRANAAFETGSIITITGFGDATPDQLSAGGPFVYDNYGNDPDDKEFRPELTPSSRTVYTWEDGTLTFTVKQRWDDEKELKLYFRVNNPDLISDHQYPTYDFTTTATIEISRSDDVETTYIAQRDMVSSTKPQGGIATAQEPLQIYTNTWTQCADGSDRSIQFWEVQEACTYNGDDFAPDVDVTVCERPVENGIVPVIGMTSVGQSECRPDMINTITVTLISNVPLGAKCAQPCLAESAITILGIKGGEMQVIEGTSETAIFNSGEDSEAAGEDSIFGERAVLPSADEVLDEVEEGVKAIQVEVQSSEVVIPGRMHIFSFNVRNGPDEQLADAIPEFIMRVNGAGLLDGYSPLHNNLDRDRYGAACYRAGICKTVRLSPALYMHKDDSSESNLPMRIHGIPEFIDFEINFPGALVAGNAVDVEISFSLNQWTKLRTGRVLEVKLWRFEQDADLTVQDNLGGAFQNGPSPTFNSGTDILSLTVGSQGDGSAVLVDDQSGTITLTVQGMRLPREGNIENNPQFNFKSDPGDCLDGWIPHYPTDPPVVPVSSGPPVGWLQTTSLDWMTKLGAGEPNEDEENRVAGREAKIVSNFRLWMDLTTDDKIVFTLPGFTGADSSGDAGDSWSYEWVEADEELSLIPKAPIDVPAIEEGEADRDFQVIVPQDAGITLPEAGVPVVQDPPFMVRAEAAAGPVLSIAVDSHQPVYRYRCQISTVTATATNQGYCNGEWAIQMCAMNSDALQTYIDTNSLTGAGGYVAASGQEVTVGGQTTTSGTPLSTCGAAIDEQCKAIGGSPELQSVTFLSYVGNNQKTNLCCKHSAEVATVGLGNLATCLTDDDCINIEAGTSSLDVAGTGVAVSESEFRICCDWCYEYYGVIACGEADFSVRGEDSSDIVNFCQVEKQCRNTAPCYGHYLEATANPPDPPSANEDLEVVTLKGDGVTIKDGDLPAGLRAPVSVFEVTPEQLSPEARGQIGGVSGLDLAGSILEFGPENTQFVNAIPIEIQVEEVEGASWELGPPPRTAVPASGSECCDCTLTSCSPANGQGNCDQLGANTNPNCASFSCNGYCSGEIDAGNQPPAQDNTPATTAAAADAATTTTTTTTTPAPARRMLDWAASGNLRHLLQAPDSAPPKGDGDDYIIYKLVDETWKAVAPSQLKSVRNDVGQQVWKVRTMISSFSIYAPFFAKYPEVAPISKYWTSAGDEVYLTIAAAVFLLLLAWLIIILPCFRREKPLPPLPPPAPPAPPPVPFLPPPPPAAPVLVTDVPPHTRYNTQGAPIKHFGPDMPGAQFEAGLDDGQVEDEFLHGAGPDQTDGMLGYPLQPESYMEEGLSYMPPAPMYGPPLPDMGPYGMSAAPQAFSAAPQPFSAAPSYPYGGSVVPHSVAPQYPGYPGQPFM